VLKVSSPLPRVGVVFSIALILRIGWVVLKGAGGLKYSDDARAYNDLAVNLVKRHQFVTALDPPFRVDLPYASRPPLTPLVIAATYELAGEQLLATQLLFALLGALTAAAVVLLGKHLFNDGIGVLAGLLVGTYPFLVFLTVVPLTENLAVMLYTLLAALLVLSRERFSIRKGVVVGLVLGLCVLNRPQIIGLLLFLPVLILGIQQPLRIRTRWLGAVVGTAALIVLPWTIRNRLVVGGWFPVSLQMGSVLLQGNNPYTHTAIERLYGGATGWHNDQRYGVALEGLSALDADREALKVAIRFIVTHPGKAFVYSVQKVGIFLRAYSDPVAGLSWYPVLVLSALGFYITRNRWKELLPIYLLIGQTVATAALFTSMPRFRAPVEPLLLLMAAVPVAALWQRLKDRRRRGSISVNVA